MSKNPVLIPQAFAANGSKNNIQNTRQPGQDPEDATWSDGFPNVTMQPIESGGLPPKGMDFNGILNALSATIVHMQKGNLFYFDKVYCDAFGGYQKGAILLADDGTKVFISVADKNTNNPNQNPQSWEVIAGIGLNAASASKLFEGRNIGGVAFDGTKDIDLPGVNLPGNQDTSGNAATASKLTNACKIGGVSFDGAKDIDLPGVNKPGNQNTSGNANTATKLQTARKITLNGAVTGSCSFNGEGDAVINTTQVIGLGLNQNVIDVTPWRAYGTIYVNQTSSPIFLSISFFHTNKREAQLWIDSILVGEVTTSNEDSQRKAVYGIVPPGKGYILTGNLDIRVWAEVR
ncbi:hypothetical protein BHC47_06160 [Snodgrassella alvi]|uniref:Tail fiber protein n=1 Tax=Snodgrassella alvi TaxID=1196083 RepID=A0A2N9Y3N4_9NEIS|nr:hypothetical protein [Snodgrassella alvi]PIT61678.1 hypothetical protein BHC56_01400 [Snodgrassella alvi]PIT62071.1 hypothetical protein BHC47_06160 [Snodgrassella alvi]